MSNAFTITIQIFVQDSLFIVLNNLEHKTTNQIVLKKIYGYSLYAKLLERLIQTFYKSVYD